MNCCQLYCCKSKRNKTVLLRFSREQLLYDIKNYAYVEGDVMKTNDAHDRHQVQDVGETGNVDRITRILDLAYSECQEMLYPYTKTVVPDGESKNDDLQENEFYFIYLSVPEDLSETTTEMWEKLIHEYMVYRAVEDWMSITKPDSAANWMAKIEDIKQKIQESKSGRVGALHRTLSPF